MLRKNFIHLKIFRLSNYLPKKQKNNKMSKNELLCNHNKNNIPNNNFFFGIHAIHGVMCVCLSYILPYIAIKK